MHLTSPSLHLFLSTLPARGATEPSDIALIKGFDFYPRSPRGERLDADLLSHGGRNFYPRSPRGERRQLLPFFHLGTVISIHAPREGSDDDRLKLRDFLGISIHAPREGSDEIHFAWDYMKESISIHAPREGSDGCQFVRVVEGAAFLSTLPARGATGTDLPHDWGAFQHFYPRSPGGERRRASISK